MNLPPKVTERAFAHLAEINAGGDVRPLRVAEALDQSVSVLGGIHKSDVELP